MSSYVERAIRIFEFSNKSSNVRQKSTTTVKYLVIDIDIYVGNKKKLLNVI